MIERVAGKLLKLHVGRLQPALCFRDLHFAVLATYLSACVASRSLGKAYVLGRVIDVLPVGAMDIERVLVNGNLSNVSGIVVFQAAAAVGDQHLISLAVKGHCMVRNIGFRIGRSATLQRSPAHSMDSH